MTEDLKMLEEEVLSDDLGTYIKTIMSATSVDNARQVFRSILTDVLKESSKVWFRSEFPFKFV